MSIFNSNNNKMVKVFLLLAVVTLPGILFVYRDVRRSRNAVLGSNISTTYSLPEPVKQEPEPYKVQNKPLNDCGVNTSSIEIFTPIYWKGYDLQANGVGELSIFEFGEYPSKPDFDSSPVKNIIYEYYGEKYENSDQPLVVPSEKGYFENCVISTEGETTLDCREDKDGPYIATNCSVPKCGEETIIKCLFDDYLPKYHSIMRLGDSSCPESSKFCQIDEFLKHAYCIGSNRTNIQGTVCDI